MSSTHGPGPLMNRGSIAGSCALPSSAHRQYPVQRDRERVVTVALEEPLSWPQPRPVQFELEAIGICGPIGIGCGSPNSRYAPRTALCRFGSSRSCKVPTPRDDCRILLRVRVLGHRRGIGQRHDPVRVRLGSAEVEDQRPVIGRLDRGEILFGRGIGALETRFVLEEVRHPGRPEGKHVTVEGAHDAVFDVLRGDRSAVFVLEARPQPIGPRPPVVAGSAQTLGQVGLDRRILTWRVLDERQRPVDQSAHLLGVGL